MKNEFEIDGQTARILFKDGLTFTIIDAADIHSI